MKGLVNCITDDMKLATMVFDDGLGLKFVYL